MLTLHVKIVRRTFNIFCSKKVLFIISSVEMCAAKYFNDLDFEFKHAAYGQRNGVPFAKFDSHIQKKYFQCIYQFFVDFTR